MSMYSRSRDNGLANASPCMPSTTCGPLTPRPRLKRSPEIWASDSAVSAVVAGVRALICMIPDPSRIRSVLAAR